MCISYRCGHHLVTRLPYSKKARFMIIWDPKVQINGQKRFRHLGNFEPCPDIFFSNTLPKQKHIESENQGPPGKEDSYWKPPFLEANCLYQRGSIPLSTSTSIPTTFGLV